MGLFCCSDDGEARKPTPFCCPSGDGEAAKKKPFLDKIGDMLGYVKDAAGDVLEVIDDAVPDMPIIIDIKGIKRAGRDVHATSRETSELCHETVDKAREIVAFGLELRETLVGLSADGTLEASKFEVIKDLVDGDRMREATALAGELGDLALQCVDKSQDMMGAIERGIDSLPDFIEDHIEDKMDAAWEKGGKEGDPELPDVDAHARELETLVTEVGSVSLFTVMTSGKNAFDGIRSKGEVCSGMFQTIRTFADDVAEASEAIQNFEMGLAFGAMRDLVNDSWRCLRLTHLIKMFAHEVGKLIRWIISLFRKASEKLGSIWGALANAKGVLADCVQYVMECLRLCKDARDQSKELCDVSAEIRDHLMNIITLDKGAIASIKDLADGDEIRAAIRLASNMDDILKECVMQILETSGKVSEAITSMPDVLKRGMSEASDNVDTEVKKTRAILIDGDDDDDKSPAEADVKGDVEELDGKRGAIEEANAFKFIGKSAEGFSGVREKISKCGDMVNTSRGFAEKCFAAIESFGGVWDLESAQHHMLELIEIVSLGKMVKHFAISIMELVRANIALMEAVQKRINDVDLVPDVIENFVEDVVDDIKGLGKKVAFWKKS